MSLKREMLVEAGIEDKAVIDNIMQAYGMNHVSLPWKSLSFLQSFTRILHCNGSFIIYNLSFTNGLAADMRGVRKNNRNQ